MRHLQSFKIFESEGSLTPEQKAFLNKYVSGGWTLNLDGTWTGSPNGTWTLNPEGKIDVEGNFFGNSENLTDFMGLKFGRVTGNFRCEENSLTSLEGSPTTVGEDFWCYDNRLTSLEGGPEEVEGDYYCGLKDNLVSLKGAPEILKGSFVGPGGIRIPAGGWSLGGIIKAWKKDEDPRRKSLLGTLLTKERLQKTIDSDPASALADLKNHFSEPWFRALDLKWPGKMGPWVDLMGDAGELGF